jgi:surfactin synthase thioesterase subunit
MLEFHVYRPELPLPCPISAFAASEDRAVEQEAVAAWRDQSSGRFTLRVIEVARFFLTSARSLVLRSIGDDLRPYLGRERG